MCTSSRVVQSAGILYYNYGLCFVSTKILEYYRSEIRVYKHYKSFAKFRLDLCIEAIKGCCILPFKKMDIQSVIIGGGPFASLLVLRPSDGDKTVRLPIRIGPIEAASISFGFDPDSSERPLTHDLLAHLISRLGGRLLCVRINAVKGTTFYAQLEVITPSGEHTYIDARPSDALALAVRLGVSIYAAQDVLDVAILPNFKHVETNEINSELARFHTFVEHLEPEDFIVSHEDSEES